MSSFPRSMSPNHRMCLQGNLARSIFDSTRTATSYNHSHISPHTYTIHPPPFLRSFPLPSFRSKDPVTSEDSIEMIKVFLNHISHAPELFRSWVEHLKNQFLPIFYPEVCKRIGCMEEDDASGFTKGCPPVISDLMVDSMEDWMGSEKVYDTLTSFKDNFTFSVEIFRQGLHLPLYFSMTIQKSINYLHDWLLDGRMPSVVQEDIQMYVRDFIDYMAYMFTRSNECANTDELTTLVALCRSVLLFYKSLAKEKYFKMDNGTWKKLMHTIVDITHNMIADQSPDTQDQTFAKLMASDCVEVLFIVWVRAQMVDEIMWLSLHRKIIQWCHWPIVVERWKSVLIQVSQEVRAIIGTITENQAGMSQKKEKGLKKKEVSITDFDGCPKIPGQVQPAFPIDIMGLTWNEENGNFLWIRIVYLLGNINNLKNPDIHATAVSAYVETADYMYTLSYKLKRGITYEPPALVDLFGPSFVEATDRQEASFDKSRALALAGLSGLVNRAPREQVTSEYLGHFYRGIFNAILSRDANFIAVIIQHNTQMFGLNFPGCNVLIPTLINIIDQLIDPDINIYRPNAQLRRDCLAMISSIINFQERFNGDSLPDLNTLKSSGETKKTVSFDEVNEKIMGILTKSLASEDDLINIQTVLWTFSNILVKEITRPEDRFSKSDFKNAMGQIMTFVNHKNDSVARTAMDSLATLIPFADLVSDSLQSNIIQSLSSKLQEAFNLNLSDATMAYMFYNLLEWLSVLPFSKLETPGISKPVFDCIQRGMAHTSSGAGSSSSSSSKGGFFGIGGSKKNEESPAQGSSSSSSSSRNISLVAEAAEVLLVHLVNVTNQFPNSKGPAQFCSTVTEEDDQDLAVEGKDSLSETPTALIFANHENQILSFVEIPTEHGIRARFISRDMTGKYAWDGIISWDELEPQELTETAEEYAERLEDGKTFYQSRTLLHPQDDLSPMDNKQKLLALADEIEEIARVMEEERAAMEAEEEDEEDEMEQADPESADDEEPELIDQPDQEEIEARQMAEYEREPGQPPVFDEDLVDKDGVYMLRSLLEFIREKYPDTIPFEEWPTNMLPEFCAAESVDIEQMERIFQQQAGFEDTHLARVIAEAKLTVAKAPKHDDKVYSSFQHCRMLMAQLGLLNLSNISTFKQIELSKNTMRALKDLDKTPSRETIKIGVLYMSEGQTDANAILQNEVGSPQYLEFIESLGWMVDVTEHSGFMGGLDYQKLTTGVNAPYFATSTTEVMFHVPTMMPNNPVDDTQAHKKRHVSADAVLIVWADVGDDGAYDPTILNSQFNYVHIIIHPLKNDMFRIEVLFKEGKVPFFGPCFNGMIIPKFLLGPMVRTTAINANRYIRYTSEGYMRPYPTRYNQISGIITRYKLEQNYEDLLSSVF
eukprot:TRINITY_DN835_c0_g1_i2.p1 TRINITY_DN835_c0_g1~~TRINITY_DN835_c0_g1_i2.p1  ORF type:complete len:1390 (-),score=473.18 TRINITY_DN835_c0_g1_i2:74-4243(-)